VVQKKSDAHKIFPRKICGEEIDEEKKQCKSEKKFLGAGPIKEAYKNLGTIICTEKKLELGFPVKISWTEKQSNKTEERIRKI
jgi:hypothetical protein